MKNNRGITVIEMIVSFSLTAIVMMLLLQLLVSLNTLYNKSGTKTELLTKQAILTEQIYNDLNNNILSISKDGLNKVVFTLTTGETRELIVNEENHLIIYNGQTTKYSEDTIVSTLNVENKIITTTDLGLNNALLEINIDVTYPNVKGDYGVHIILPHSEFETPYGTF